MTYQIGGHEKRRPGSRRTVRENLPAQLTTLIGREREVAAVCALLRRPEVRLVTLTGTGGVGKTRLGLQVATEVLDAFAEGVFFVSLAPISDPDLVVPTIAQAFGVKESADRTLLDLLKAYLRDKFLLLLLDNFEQVLTAAVQVTDLLAACPKLKVVVTSRAVLHIRGEQEFTVLPLAVPDPKHLPDLLALLQYEAVALFLQRAQAAKPEFHLTDANAPTIAEICVRLDGLPLAIELAAARVKLLPPQALLTRLERRLQVLTGGSRDLPERQQTLRNTIAWSYQLLDASERRLFQRLCVFVGGCTIEAVEAVCTALDGEAAGVLDGISSLINKNLVLQTVQEGKEPRLMILETIREYGFEVFAARGEMQAIQRAHADYYLGLAEEAEQERRTVQQARWLERLEREHNNLRAVLHWLMGQEDREMALRLCSTLVQFWRVRGHASEGRQWLERALLESDGVKVSVRAEALFAAADLAFYERDLERGRRLLEVSLTLYRKQGDKKGVARVLMWLGVGLWKNNQSLAQSMVENALAVFKEIGDHEGITEALKFLGHRSFYRGDYAKALVLYEESLQVSRNVGDKEYIATLLSMDLAKVLLYQGDHGRARTCAQEGLELFRELGDGGGIAHSLNTLAEIALNQGNITAAYPLLKESLERSQEADYKRVLPRTRSLLARIAFSQHDYEAARTLYEESLAVDMEIDDKLNIASGLQGLASVVVAQGQLPWAARLWGTAEILRESMGVPIPPVERATYERTVAAARAQIGEKAFAAAWAKGRLMTPEQALAAHGPVTIPSAFTTAGHPATPPAKSLPTYPDGLSAREVEVLRLVAQGLTNAQVAEQLVISPRTVNTHLISIFGKIQVSTRSAATRHAIEHHIV